MRHRKPKPPKQPQGRQPHPVRVAELVLLSPEEASWTYFVETGHTIPAGVMETLLRAARRRTSRAERTADVIADFARSSFKQPGDPRPSTTLYKLIVGRTVYVHGDR